MSCMYVLAISGILLLLCSDIFPGESRIIRFELSTHVSCFILVIHNLEKLYIKSQMPATSKSIKDISRRLHAVIK